VRDQTRSQPWGRSLQDLVAALPGLFGDRLELLALELQRAGRSLVRIVLLMLLAAILGVTAWLALCGGIALVLVALGSSWPLATLAVLLVNLLLAWAALARIHRLVATLGLPATRRHLAFGAGAEAVASDPLLAPLPAAPSQARP
jgi:uncharacterized membrane protein YqjE